MKINKVLYTILLIPLFLMGCKDEIVTEDDFNNPPGGQLSKFSQIQTNVFSTTCAVSGCHAGNNPQAGLNLSAGSAYSFLVNVDSRRFPGQKRVVPGNKEASVLYNALSYTLADLKMPPNGKLSQNIIDSIGAWIDKGAPND